ncbi:uncharacterized protein LOC128960074 [Oppia nitens]|uniref:uncharacterized protein LOC128960074 n=1 Tax=Oppia nitens TaxID=1686743 RepID=UPI0023DAB7BA|nr:uncharacterized protein LOC128960074 [Oppia nitens]
MPTISDNQRPRDGHKPNLVVLLLFVLIVSIVLFYLTKSDDLVAFVIICVIILTISSLVICCVRCCCRRRLSRGAVLSPHLVVTQVVTNGTTGQQNSANNVRTADLRHQMTSHLRQHTTPLMPSMTYPPVSCMPTAPPIDESSDSQWSDNHKLPTYEEAVQSKY